MTTSKPRSRYIAVTLFMVLLQLFFLNGCKKKKEHPEISSRPVGANSLMWRLKWTCIVAANQNILCAKDVLKKIPNPRLRAATTNKRLNGC